MVVTKSVLLTRQVAKKQPSTSTTKKTPKAGSSDDTLETCLGMINQWLDYRKKLMPAWERDTKLYNNERYKRGYEGIADTFVPMTFSTIEAMSSALLTADYNTDFVPQDIYKYLKDSLMPAYTGTVTGEDGEPVEETEEQFLVRAIQEALKGGVIKDESLEVLNAYYDYLFDNGCWEEVIGEMIDDGLQIGNGATWMTFENGKPRLISVAFPDYVFDPTGRDDDTVRFAGRRYLASIKELKDEKIVDPVTGVSKERYNLSGLKKRSTNQDRDKTDKEMLESVLLGSTLTLTDSKGKLKEDNDQCEVIVLMTNERMYTIVNRSCVAENVENPIVAQAKLKGADLSEIIKIPGTTWANNKRGSLFVGRSETSTFWKEQERLNDATNQKSDAVTRALLQTYRADPALKAQKNSFGVPGAVIWGTAGQWEANVPAQVPSAAFSEEISIKNNIRETTATDQIVKGVGSSSDVTATEAKLQVAQSGQRIEKKIKKLENGPLKRIARLALQYIRLFISDPMIVPQKGNGGINPLLFNPAKYSADFEPKVTLTIQAQHKRKQEQQDGIESYKILISDPSNDPAAVKEIMLPKIIDLDKDEIARIVSSTAKAPASPLPTEIPV